jgi:hypothetical protein
MSLLLSRGLSGVMTSMFILPEKLKLKEHSFHQMDFFWMSI